MSGAKQIRAPCPHVADRPSELTFHSVVTESNTSYWEDERLPADVDESDLEAVLEYAGDDVTVAVCNSCRRIKVDPGPESEVVHSGDPHADDRVGERLVDVHAADETVAAFGGGR